LTYAGIAGIGILFALMFFIGVIDLNVRILASTLPFLIFAVLAIRQHRAPRRRGHGPVANHLSVG